MPDRARRPLLLPLVPAYRAALAARAGLARAGLLRPGTLTWPVLSVGSLSAGGAGKTPAVRAIATLLEQLGWQPHVLSRGYGRASTAVERVDPAGTAGTAARYGDEPLELARTGLPVFVGASRLAAGRLAELAGAQAGTANGLHLLDDGFQHHALSRTADLVLLTAQDVHDHLLPAGNLREPLSALRRAHAVLLREDEAAELAPLVARYHAAPPWVLRRTLHLPPDVPSRPLAFCAIARPQGFLQMLTEAGCEPAGFLAFPDHHAWTGRDLARLEAAARLCGANGFLTTAKDAARLTPPDLARLGVIGPVAVAVLRVTFTDPAAVRASLAALLPPQEPA